ncbi:hypothetical protein NDU88_001124 [Pleurodeles waltl]|uniref:Alpha-macroglobulin receptor-binding domain-containing protein n=1 Tax=Pleurodeles waltl TaxID=8319 RepID=A0AAV7Q653_PLEWA|nr:hypothetical protein NDU88_001124 [Pleurodeles waltl]
MYLAVGARSVLPLVSSHPFTSWLRPVVWARPVRGARVRVHFSTRRFSYAVQGVLPFPARCVFACRCRFRPMEPGFTCCLQFELPSCLEASPRGSSRSFNQDWFCSLLCYGQSPRGFPRSLRCFWARAGGSGYNTHSVLLKDTVVALEALSRYWTKTYSTEGSNLALTISSPQRQYSKALSLDKYSKRVEEELQLSLESDLNVEVKGKGKGTLTILRLYNMMQVENNTCQELNLNIELTEDVREPDEDADYDYSEGDDVNEEPSARIHWQDLRSRRRRQAVPLEGKTKEVVYMVYLWREERSKLSGMAIVDITMLSGFDPNLEDLNKLKDLKDRYISHYEYMYGRLLLYFQTVPVEKDLISFHATQTVKVGSLQPASAAIYDFYEPGSVLQKWKELHCGHFFLPHGMHSPSPFPLTDRKCNIIYNLPSRSKLVNALCSGDVCHCAEGK